MKIPDIIIAVDGYSSTGKSTFAKAVARKFGFLYLDSGALYRGVTLFAMENGLILEGNVIDSRLERALENIEFNFGEENRLYMGQRCIEKDIRTMEVSSLVSPVSALPYVRHFVDDNLHRMAASGRVVMDGRDIGATVFPTAELKVFMIADDEVRARRRYDELVAKGEKTTLEEVMKNLKERDYIDSHRTASPLRRAEDSFELDNTEMTIHEEICWIQGLIQGKFGIL